MPTFSPPPVPTTSTTVPKKKPKKKTAPTTTSTTVPQSTTTSTTVQQPKTTPTTTPVFDPQSTGFLVRYPSADWLIKNAIPKNLSAEEKAKWTAAINDITKTSLIPTSGIQNPTPEQYLSFMANDLLQAATAAGAKDPNKVRDSAMDAIFKIKNWDWRDVVGGDPTTKAYSNAKKRLGMIWTNVTSQGLENLRRESFNFNETGSDAASQIQAIIDGLAVSANAQATAGVKSNAANAMDNQLDSWGLGALKPHLEDLVWKQGVTNTSDLLKIVRNTPEYKARFAGMIKHNADPRFPVKLSEGSFLSTEKTMMDVASQYLPPNFFTEQKAADLISKGVDVEEFKNRVMKGYSAAMSADATTRKYLAAQGVDLKHLAAYFLDPKVAEPILTQQVAKATLRGYAENVGLQDFTQSMADQLAEQVRKASTNPYGTFTMDEARKAIEFAGANQGLSGAAPGAATPTVNTNQLIGSQIPGFAGTSSAEAEAAVTKAQQAQTAPFSKGGGPEVSNRGVTGTGYAPQ